MIDDGRLKERVKTFSAHKWLHMRLGMDKYRNGDWRCGVAEGVYANDYVRFLKESKRLLENCEHHGVADRVLEAEWTLGQWEKVRDMDQLCRTLPPMLCAHIAGQLPRDHFLKAGS